MDINKAVGVLEALGNGVNPTTGEILPDEALYNSPEIIRALLCCTHFIKNPPRKARRTPEQKRAENLAKGLPANAGMPWTDDLRLELATGFASGNPVNELADKFERTRGSIVAELQRQGLVNEDEARNL